MTIIMDKYYLLGSKDSKNSVASAFAPDRIIISHELIAALDNVEELPFELNLVKLTVNQDGLKVDADLNGLRNIWLDYQPNSFALPLLSEKFKTLIEKQLTGNEGVNWISVKINARNEQKIYFLLRFEKMLDVLDIEKTLFVEGTNLVIRPVFSIAKICKYSLFQKPSDHNFWKIPSAIYINEELRKMIVKEKISGVSFEQVRVSEM